MHATMNDAGQHMKKKNKNEVKRKNLRECIQICILFLHNLEQWDGQELLKKWKRKLNQKLIKSKSFKTKWRNKNKSFNMKLFLKKKKKSFKKKKKLPKKLNL